MIMYLIINYGFVALMCIAGQFNRSFNGNSFQRLGLAMAAVWALWRIQILSNGAWKYPHEPLIVTAMGLYAIGTLLKTRYHCLRRRKFQRLMRARGGQK